MLLLHAKFGPGIVMVGVCRLFMLLTNAAGISAIVLMWLLYPREVTFQPALAASVTLMQVRAVLVLVLLCVRKGAQLFDPVAQSVTVWQVSVTPAAKCVRST